MIEEGRPDLEERTIEDTEEIPDGEETTAPFFFYCNILHKFTYPQLKLLTNTENKIHVNLKSRKSHLDYITDVFLVFAFTIILVTKH